MTKINAKQQQAACNISSCIDRSNEPRIHLPLVGFGCSKLYFDEILQGLEAGVRYLDSARLYANEDEVGRAVQCFLEKNAKICREDLIVSSKAWCQEFSHGILQSCRASLSDMKLDYLDIFLLHWPFVMTKVPFQRDSSTTLRQVWRQMEDLVIKRKLVRCIGVSNFDQSQINDLLEWSELRIKPALNQIECHVHMQNQDLVEYCHQKGIHVVAWGPLNQAKSSLLKDEPVLSKLARKHNCSVPQILLRFNIQRGITVIPASTRRTHVETNLAVGVDAKGARHCVALDQVASQVQELQAEFQSRTDNGVFNLSKEEMNQIRSLDRGERRFPDIIGIWPTSSGLVAVLFGRVVGLLFWLLTAWRGGLDIIQVRRMVVEREIAKRSGGKRIEKGTDRKEI